MDDCHYGHAMWLVRTTINSSKGMVTDHYACQYGHDTTATLSYKVSPKPRRAVGPITPKRQKAAKPIRRLKKASA